MARASSFFQFVGNARRGRRIGDDVIRFQQSNHRKTVIGTYDERFRGACKLTCCVKTTKIPNSSLAVFISDGWGCIAVFRFRGVFGWAATRADDGKKPLRDCGESATRAADGRPEPEGVKKPMFALANGRGWELSAESPSGNNGRGMRSGS
jgi:hypothetical protein